MEEIYRGKKKPGIFDRNRINLKKYFNVYRDLVEAWHSVDDEEKTDVACALLKNQEDSTSKTDDSQHVSRSMNIDPDLLRISGEPIPFALDETIEIPERFVFTQPPAQAVSKLKTLQQRAKYAKPLNPIKHNVYHRLNTPNSGSKDGDLSIREEIIVTVQIYLPFQSMNFSARYKKPPKCQQEIVILGSQTLMDLRQVIICMDDYRSIDGDVSENPSLHSSVTYREKYPSSMFFIDETFYIDKKAPTDYSVVVKKWAAFRNIDVNQKTMDMRRTKIRDLNIKLHYPYVFQHLGNCEHLVVFANARLLSERDSVFKSHYPSFSKLVKEHGKMCVICNTCHSKWIVVGYKRLVNDFACLCEVCFKNYCYIGGKKIGSFQAYHYYDRRALTDD